MKRFYILVVPNDQDLTERGVGERGWAYIEDKPLVFWYNNKADQEGNYEYVASTYPNRLVSLGELTKAIRFPVGELNKVKIGNFGVLPDND
jgi:hypothetical protein